MPSLLPPTINIDLENQTIQWQQVGGMHHYNIYRSTRHTLIHDDNWIAMYTPTTVSSDCIFFDNDALVGTMYYYVITSVDNEHRESIMSNEISVTWRFTTNATLINGDDHGFITILWNKIPNAISYSIYRSITNTKDIQSPLMSGITTNSFDDNIQWFDNIEYRYYVKAIDKSGSVINSTGTSYFPSSTLFNHQMIKTVSNPKLFIIFWGHSWTKSPLVAKYMSIFNYLAETAFFDNLIQYGISSPEVIGYDIVKHPTPINGDQDITQNVNVLLNGYKHESNDVLYVVLLDPVINTLYNKGNSEDSVEGFHMTTKKHRFAISLSDVDSTGTIVESHLILNQVLEAMLSGITDRCRGFTTTASMDNNGNLFTVPLYWSENTRQCVLCLEKPPRNPKLTIIHNTDNSVLLNWDGDAKSYHVIKNNAVIAYGISDISFLDNVGTIPGNTSEYKIIACSHITPNYGFNSSFSVSNSCVLALSPLKPKKIKIINKTSDSIQFSWDGHEGDKEYFIGSPYNKITHDNSITILQLSPNTSYIFNIQAIGQNDLLGESKSVRIKTDKLLHKLDIV